MPGSDDGATHVTTPGGAPAARLPALLRGTIFRCGRLAQPRHPGEQILPALVPCGKESGDVGRRELGNSGGSVGASVYESLFVGGAARGAWR